MGVNTGSHSVRIYVWMAWSWRTGLLPLSGTETIFQRFLLFFFFSKFCTPFSFYHDSSFQPRVPFTQISLGLQLFLCVGSSESATAFFILVSASVPYGTSHVAGLPRVSAETCQLAGSRGESTRVVVPGICALPTS